MSKKLLATGLAVLTFGGAPMALSHLVKDEAMQSYRQSYFTLIAMNFGPMTAMVKGDMPWDDAKMLALAEDFAAIASVDVARAFGPGSDKGTTRAKPEIWENTDDFLEKYAALQSAAEGLLAAAQSGDRGTIGGAIKDTGGACKACHDEYKAKDYLY
ncbi:MAG: cytochrome c556 [Glaciecola sp.]|jgi:cytochrome c556|uniref:c-type cytochrome n=1 Tax=Congregibacter sp. TaxID=2744308 RepID=UPI0039E4746A